MVVDMVDEQAIDTWKAVLGDLQLQVSKPIYETWLKDTVGLSIADNIITVGVPTPFAMEWLERRMYQPIQETVKKVTTESLEVRFQVGESFHNNGPQNGSNGHPAAPAANDPQPQGRTMELQAPVLNAKYSFKSFVVGPSNRLGYSAAKAVADAPGQTYNPLFLYSGVGLGKTHLLHAIGHDCAEKGMSFAYVTSEKFTNEFIAAIGNRTTEEFRNKYRSVDVLLIDDIQFISGKEQTQEGFFHTFNALHLAGRQIVITSDRPAAALTLLEDRVRSRLAGGIVVDIQLPDYETRLAILRTKAEEAELSFPEDVLQFLAEGVHSNIRELEGYLNRVAAYAELSGRDVSLEMVRQVLSDSHLSGRPRAVSSDDILTAVAHYFALSEDAIIGRRRDKQTAMARHVAMYLLREEANMTATAIGRMLGGKDHSTVLHACNRISSEMDVEPRLRQDVFNIRASLNAA
jgi:chromosomal replication initiator protein